MALAFYAEYLPNIKSVTITLSNVEPGSSYGLTTPGTDLRIVSPKGEIRTIALPARCNPSSPAGMRVSQDPTRAEQTVVVRVSAVPLSTFSNGGVGEVEEPLVPWSASQLHSQVEVCCKGCWAPVVERGKIATWKDLPSEGWAEMMDLWHCHKPDEHDHGGRVDAKGYAAGSKLVARRGVGLVDALGFLIKEGDCVNFDVEQCTPNGPSIRTETDGAEILTQKQAQQKVSCKSCSALLGFVDEQTEGLKLLKPFLALSFRSPSASAKTLSNASLGTILRVSTPSLEGEPTAVETAATPAASTSSPTHALPTSQPTTEPPLQTFTTANWLAAYLLTLIETTGIRKFSIKSNNSSNDQEGEIWIFSTTLTYTSSSTPTSAITPASIATSQLKPTEAMKILYKIGSPARDDMRKDGESMRKANLMVEELRLPLGLEQDLWRCLEASHELLPPGAAKFMDWDVGLLEKPRSGGWGV